MEQAHPAPRDHSRLVRKLLLLVAGAFAFAFALVPLYNVLCEVTGFNGKTSAGFAAGGLNVIRELYFRIKSRIFGHDNQIINRVCAEPDDVKFFVFGQSERKLHF